MTATASVPPGALSTDGWWKWTGAAWVPAVSRDGFRRWDGSGWRPAMPPRMPRPWRKRWSIARRIALGLWSALLPAAGAADFMFAVFSPNMRVVALGLGILIAVVWSGVVGGFIAPAGHWRDVPLATVAGIVALLVGLILIYAVGLAVDDCDTAVTRAQLANCTDEHAASIGFVCGVVVGAALWAAMLPFALAAAFVRARVRPKTSETFT